MASDIGAKIVEWQKQLLDTSKRNRLIKFTTVRGGGVKIIHPGCDDLWNLLVSESKTLLFPWKRDILGVPGAAIDGVERTQTQAAARDADHTNSSAPASTMPSSVVPPNDRKLKAYVEEDPRPSVPRIVDHTERCLSSQRLLGEQLLTEQTDKGLAASLLRLHRTALEAETEHGVSTLYAAFGFLRWYESEESKEELVSPLVLLPVDLDREAIDSPWELAAKDDELKLNECLAMLLGSSFKLSMPGVDDEFDMSNSAGLASYFDRVRDRIRAMKRWEVLDEVGLGIFSFQKLAMWEDMKQHQEQIKEHPLCRAIAEGGLLDSKGASVDFINASELDDRVAPEEVTHILDADSSQHEAIEAVKRGAHVVIDGPPGTGKSQTIANCIAELLAKKMRVLFVSEKMAALDVVKRRLDKRGLGDFCLELHSHKANKKDVLSELGRCLELSPDPYPDISTDLQELAQNRAVLNAYARELHRPRLPLNKSAFQVHGELASLASDGNSAWTCGDIEKKTGSYLREVCDVLAQFATCKEVVRSPLTHPWRGCQLTVVSQAALADIRRHLEVLRHAASTVTGEICEKIGVEAARTTINRWKQEVDAARQLLRIPEAPAAWFTGNPIKAGKAAMDLHAATMTARSLAESLGMFDLQQLEVGQPIFDSPPAGASGEGRFELRSKTLRSQKEELDTLAATLGIAIDLLEKMKPLTEELLQRMQLSARRVSVGEVKNFAKLGGSIASLPAIPPKYWDGKFREELLTVINQVSDLSNQAAASRTELISRFRPSALEEDASVPFAAIRLASKSWWRRWLPSWAKYQQVIDSWYVEGIPAVPVLASDLDRLHDHRRRIAYVREMEQSHGDYLVQDSDTGEEGRWETTKSLLHQVERFEKMKVPSPLQSAMAPGGDLDRDRLRELSLTLKNLAARLHDTWPRLSPWFAPSELESLGKQTPAELHEHLQRISFAAIAQRDRLVVLTNLLWDDEDPEGIAWDSTIESINQWSQAREKATIAAEVAGVSNSGDSLLETDWSQLDQAGRGVITYFRKDKRLPEPNTVRGLTDPVYREGLKVAVETTDRLVHRGFDESWQFVSTRLFHGEKPCSTGIVLAQATLPELSEWFKDRLSDLSRMGEWIRFRDLRQRGVGLGVSRVIDEMGDGTIPVEKAPLVFTKRFLGQWLDHLYESVPALRSFETNDHEQLIGRFKQLDQLSIDAAPARLRAHLLADPDRPRYAGNPPADSELGTLLKEVNKKRRQRALRKLFGLIPNLLPRLKPCMMMSPLAVSTYLNGTNMSFDVVIFDEASQVRPHDAVCAIYRGRQLVVAGDPKQLPPTNFFSKAMGDEAEGDEEADSITDFESLLDVCLSLGLARRRLKWHYRSRREGLIAFSNRFFYENTLVTFPSASDADDAAVRFVYLAEGVFDEGVNAVEARKTAELVMEHFRESKDQSLGVIAFSMAQQNRILDELERLRRANPDLENCFDEQADERFFVKNLENVQGDERDVIILAIGYGRKPNGTISMNFGPLNKQGGERRLNVAVTRARQAMVVVSSMRSHDIDLSRTQTRGPTLLRAFLDYAERGRIALAESVSTDRHADFDSGFEEQVYSELSSRGLSLHKQIGCGGYKIDLAVVDSQQTGRYVLGIECDGAAYHSTATARDRDRLRQAVLEDLGWKICRIWSTDWIRNRDKQIQKVLDALATLSDSDREETNSDSLNGRKLITPQVNEVEPRAYAFGSIEEVPDQLIKSLLLNNLRSFGDTRDADLFKAASARLGFQRMGHRIEGRLKNLLNELVASGQVNIRPDDGWIRLSDV